MRPAWASTWRWKSSQNLVTGTGANRKLGTARDLMEEAGSETCGPTNRNRIGGGAARGERA